MALVAKFLLLFVLFGQWDFSSAFRGRGDPRVVLIATSVLHRFNTPTRPMIMR